MSTPTPSSSSHDPPPPQEKPHPPSLSSSTVVASNKARMRTHVWDLLEQNRDYVLEDYPPDCHEKIPHFKGCKNAAHAFARTQEFRNANVIKINPSLAQMELRFLVLQRGKCLVCTEPMSDAVLFADEGEGGESGEVEGGESGKFTEEEIFEGNSVDKSAKEENSGIRLADEATAVNSTSSSTGAPTDFSSKFTFYLLDPAKIPKSKLRKAVTKAGMRQYGEILDLSNTNFFIDIVVVGVTAVSATNGVRLGKGKGYAEREWAICERAGLVDRANTWVATTCHSLQSSEVMERGDYMDETHDLPVHFFVTEDGRVHWVTNYYA